MKKNTIIYIIVFVVLAVTSAVLLLKRSQTTLPKALTDFAVPDTDRITKIHLTDHFKNDITLERKGQGIWMVDAKYKVNQAEIEVLLMTIKEVKVKNPVPKPARDNVIKDLATNGIKIEIFNNADLVKSYYVGSSTADDEGTYMLIQGSSEPFVTHIPGFVGYLTTRYITSEQKWRSTDIYHLNPADIKEIKVLYTNSDQQSYILKADQNDYLLYKADTTLPPVKLNPMLAKKYLVGFRAINFEAFTKMKPAEKDSVFKSKSYATVYLYTNSFNYPPLVLYPVYADNAGGNAGMEIENFYALFGPDKNDLVIMQTLMVGKILAFHDELANGKVRQE